MSELEKLQRDAYQQHRKKLILIQTVIILVLTLAMIVSSVTFLKMNKDTYVYYAEEGNVLYKAYLADNAFYSEEYLNGNHAYVAALIERMTAEFTYDLQMDAKNVDFKYSYRVDAQLEVKDKTSGAAIYNPIYNLVPETEEKVAGNALSIDRTVELDYHIYDQHARDFLAAYGLSDTVSTLYVRMYVDVVGMSEAFASDSTGDYVIQLSIPLVQTTLKPESTTTVPTGAQKILAVDHSAKGVFRVLAIVFGSLDGVMLVVLALFVILTRDEHIDYARRVQKIVTSYKSYIQKINNAFDAEGYQILYVNTFTEMLEIRDTLQIPILMFENEDKTCAQFLIATCTRILYLFEVKVEEGEDDEPVGPTPDPDPMPESAPESADEAVTEPPVGFTFTEEDIAEAMAAPDVALSDIDYVDTPTEAYTESGDAPGVEVVGVVWPERAKKNKIYRYDPNGESLSEGDIVLVPSRDVASQKDIVRKATVAHGNYLADPATLHHPLKKIIRVVKRNIKNYFES